MNGPPGEIDQELVGIRRTQLNFVTNAPDIKTIVICVNSPGGSASISDELFSEVAKLRERKPGSSRCRGWRSAVPT